MIPAAAGLAGAPAFAPGALPAPHAAAVGGALVAGALVPGALVAGAPGGAAAAAPGAVSLAIAGEYLVNSDGTRARKPFFLPATVRNGRPVPGAQDFDTSYAGLMRPIGGERGCRFCLDKVLTGTNWNAKMHWASCCWNELTSNDQKEHSLIAIHKKRVPSSAPAGNSISSSFASSRLSPAVCATRAD